MSLKEQNPMPRPGKSESVAEKPKNYAIFTTSVSAAVGLEIKADALADDRSESYVIRQILTAHYAPRLAKTAKQPRQRLAA